MVNATHESLINATFFEFEGVVFNFDKRKPNDPRPLPIFNRGSVAPSYFDFLVTAPLMYEQLNEFLLFIQSQIVFMDSQPHIDNLPGVIESKAMYQQMQTAILNIQRMAQIGWEEFDKGQQAEKKIKEAIARNKKH